MKKLCTAILCVALLAGCSSNSKEPTNKTTQPDVVNLQEEYPEIKDESLYEVVDSKQLLDLYDHGTGVVYLSFPQCPWCHYFLPLVEEAATNNDTKIYYYDVYLDRKEENKTYQDILKALDGHLDYDNDGNPRVYVPDCSILKNGEMIYHTNETSQISSKETSPQEYWSEDVKQESLQRLNEAMKKLND